LFVEGSIGKCSAGGAIDLKVAEAEDDMVLERRKERLARCVRVTRQDRFTCRMQVRLELKCSNALIKPRHRHAVHEPLDGE
jgi:hypothetical protein